MGEKKAHDDAKLHSRTSVVQLNSGHNAADWSESFSSLPTDTEAEAMVSCPGLIVYPYIEEDEVIEDTASEWEEEKPISKRKRFRGKLKGKVKSKLKRFRRVRVDQTTGMVAGAVIVLGIAMAVYGVQMRDRHPGAGMGLASGVLHGHGTDWRKVAGWVGGVFARVTEKVVSGLSPTTARGGGGSRRLYSTLSVYPVVSPHSYALYQPAVPISLGVCAIGPCLHCSNERAVEQ
ncbi:hypothetical protein C0991_005563 [Blastosporella zonata]|nr:hypothetical protein C0991_005563 [Blastosporella zonata]